MTPDQEDQVRRVLGSLPPEGPVPPAVAERLDAALADLVAERGAGPVETTPDELSSRRAERTPAAVRRRQRRRTGLVAAAAVAVVGLGLTTVVDDLTGGDSETASTQAASDAAPEAGRELVGPDSGAPGAADEDTGGGSAGAPLPAGVVLLTATRQDLGSGTLAADAARVAALGPEAPAREGVDGGSAGPEPGGRRLLAAVTPCVVPETASGDAVAPVRLDGEPATLVVRGTSGGARVARVYSCDGGDAVLATTTVPAP